MKKLFFILLTAISINAFSQTTELPSRVIKSEREGNLRTRYVFYGDLQTNSQTQTAKISYVKEIWVINSDKDSVLIKGDWEDLTLPLAQYPNAAGFIPAQTADAIKQFFQFYLSQKP